MTTRRTKLTLVVASAVALSGCALFKAATFQGDDATSFQREGSKVRLEVYAAKSAADCEKDESRRAQAEALPAALIAAVVEVGLNLGTAAVQDYLDQKKKEFTAVYTASVSVPFYYPKDPSGPSPFNCIRLQRTLPTAKGDARQLAFEWVGAIETTPSASAQRISTVGLRLARAAARTDRATRQVDVSVEVKVDAILLDKDGQPTSVSVTDKVLAYPSLVTPGDTGVPVSWSKPDVASSWFPAIPVSAKEAVACAAAASCKGVTAVTVFAQVTEVGTGGDDFGNLSKQIDDNKKTAIDAIVQFVSDKLKK